MIVSFEGPQGTCKTTSAVSLAFKEYCISGRKIISNDHLLFPYTQFNMQYFVDNLATTEMEKCIILLDESQQYMDARMTQSKENRVFSYFVGQARKRFVDLYLPTHSIMNIDSRIRPHIDLRGACSSRIEKPCHLCKGTGKPQIIKNGKFSSTKGVFNEEGKRLDVRFIDDKEVEVCPLCRAYKERDEEDDPEALTCVTYGRVFFLRSRAQRGQLRRFTYDIIANQYFDCYDTGERMPIRSKSLTGIDVVEVV